MAVVFYTVLLMSAYFLSSIGVLSHTPTTEISTADTSSAYGTVDEDRSIYRNTGKDAVIETTPAFCNHGERCGFQVYDPNTQLPSLPYIHYCNCLEGTECVQVGENMPQYYLYYKCKNITQPEETTTSVASTTEQIETSSGAREQRSKILETQVAAGTEKEVSTNVPVVPEESDASGEVKLLRSRVGLIVDHNEL